MEIPVPEAFILMPGPVVEVIRFPMIRAAADGPVMAGPPEPPVCETSLSKTTELLELNSIPAALALLAELRILLLKTRELLLSVKVLEVLALTIFRHSKMTKAAVTAVSLPVV